MTKWQYLIQRGPQSRQELNQIGEHGWELVTIEHKTEFVKNSARGVGSAVGVVEYVFKRPKVEAETKEA